MKSLVLASLMLAAPKAHKTFPKPGYISATARAVLDDRMQRHGEAAMRLSLSVVLLEYADTWEVAKNIAEEPGLSRPRPGEQDTINALLPGRFFELQDQLRVHAKELGDAAMAKNDAKIAAAYGKLTATCVACHSVYLNGSAHSSPAK